MKQIYIWNPLNTALMMVNIDLRHQYGISVAEAQTSPQRDVPSGEEQGETAVFAGYRP